MRNEELAAELRAKIDAWHDCAPAGQGEGWSADATEKFNAMAQAFYENQEAILATLSRPVAEAQPRAYLYRYSDPMSGEPVWRSSGGLWNGQRPSEVEPLYDGKTVLALSSPPDAEAVRKACVAMIEERCAIYRKKAAEADPIGKDDCNRHDRMQHTAEAFEIAAGEIRALDLTQIGPQARKGERPPAGQAEPSEADASCPAPEGPNQ